MLVHRDELRDLRLAALGRLAPECEAGPRVRHLALIGLLKSDVDLLVDALVIAMLDERPGRAA